MKSTFHGGGNPRCAASYPSTEKTPSRMRSAARMIVLVAIIGVSLLFNAPLEEAANPLHSTNPAKAPWYFVGIQELVSYSAFLGGIVVPIGIVAGLLLLPYLDRNPKGTGVWFSRDRKLATLLFSIFVVAMVVLILIGQFVRGPNWVMRWPWS